MQKDPEQEVEEIYQDAKKKLEIIYLRQKELIQSFKKKSEESKINKIREKII